MSFTLSTEQLRRQLSLRPLVRSRDQLEGRVCSSPVGPKINTVEKLTELRHAGVNIGLSSTRPAFSHSINTSL